MCASLGHGQFTVDSLTKHDNSWEELGHAQALLLRACRNGEQPAPYPVKVKQEKISLDMMHTEKGDRREKATKKSDVKRIRLRSRRNVPNLSRARGALARASGW